jgi:GAF domain-containing protein
MAPNNRLLETLREISSILLSDESLRSTLERVAFLSVRAMDACDGAGVSIRDGSQVVTVASSDERVQVIDEIQYRQRDGPCLQAMDDAQIYTIDSMEEETRWPRFVEHARELGVGACLSIPLLEGANTFGSLNLYSYGEKSFTADDEAAGVALAAQASGPLANMRRYVELQLIASDLERASESPVAVAAGVLMERDGSDRARAMEKLSSLAEKHRGDIEAAARVVLLSVVSDSDGDS